MAEPRLKAVLTMDDTKFQAGLRRAQAGAARFSSTVTSKVGPAIAGGFAAAGTVLAAAFSYQTFKDGIKGALDAGERLNDLRAITGATTASLSRLSDVFEASGAPAEMLEKGISRMQKAVFEAGNGSKILAPLMGKLGLNFDEFNELEPDEQFIRLGKAISALPNATDRTGIAMAIFGRTGAKMLETFEGFNELDFKNLDRRAAFFQRNAADFDRLNGAIRKAKQSSQEFFLVLASKMLPTIEKVSNAIANTNFGALVDKLKEAIDRTLSFPQTVGKVLSGDAGMMQAAGAAIGGAFMGGVKQRSFLQTVANNNRNNGARASVAMMPSTTGGIDAFKARGVNATLPQLQSRRLGALTAPTTQGDEATGLNAAKAPIGLDSVFLSPSRSAGGVRKRGESKEDFRARMDAAKRGEKMQEAKDTSLEGLVKQIVESLEGR